MSLGDRRKREGRKEMPAMQILEEAFHLLRSVDLKYYFLFYLGAVPFVVGLLYFAADMGRSSLADQRALAESAVIAALFLWMKYCQARFCEGLWKTVNPAVGGESQRGFGEIAAMWCFFSFQFPILLVGLFFVMPLGWIVAMYQNATVLAFRPRDDSRKLRWLVKNSLVHSHREWAQNHGILIVFLFVFLFTWANVIGTCFVAAMFTKAFFGVESIFTLSPLVAVSNSTFFLGSILLAYLVVSPMLKAAYVLRCFYANSRETGEDLMSRLADCKSSRRAMKRREIPGARSLSVLAIAATVQLAASTAPASEPVSAPAFQEELADTLEQKKYQWQLSRHDFSDSAGDDDSWLARRLREVAESTQEVIKDFGDWLDEMIERMMDRSKRGRQGAADTDWDGLMGLGSTLSVTLIVIVVILLGWLLVVLYRKYRRNRAFETIDVEDVGPVDLQSEDVIATQLPENEWMRLAREQLAKGDSRLAIRAMFLATLANLGERDIVKVARFKSNRDYRKELELKARKSKGLRGAFEENTVLFEEVWYGLHQAKEGNVDAFLKNYQLITQEAGAAIGGVANSQEGVS